MLLTEAMYFGKSPELLVIEENFKIILDRFRRNFLYNPTSSKENSIIEKNFAKLFNFENVEICWETNISANAYTYSQVNSLIPITNTNFEIEKTNKGIKFREAKGKIALITLFTGLMSLDGVNESILTAAVLHEIGHNFYNSNYLKVFGSFITIISLTQNISKLITSADDDFKKQLTMTKKIIEMLSITTNTGKKTKINIDSFDRRVFDGLFHGTKSLIFGLYDAVLALKNTLHILHPVVLATKTTLAIKSTLSDIIITALKDGYRDEKFADNFATMYGYGKEIAEYQYIFYKSPKNILEKCMDYTIVGSYYRFISDSVMSIIMFGTEHPAYATRIKDQKRLLENALKDSPLSAEAKKAIKQQIKEIDTVYKKYTDLSDSNLFIFRKIMKFIRIKLKISDEDWKEFIWKTSDYNWDNVIADNLYKGEN